MNPQTSPPIPVQLKAARCAARAASGRFQAAFDRVNGHHHGAQAIGERRALQALACAERQAREERLS